MFQSILNFLSSVAFAIAATFGISMGTEQAKFEVLERVGDSIEIRQYPMRIVAETTIDTNKSDNPRGDAFRIVAGYIFGANKERQKIEMTSPVEISSKGKTIPMTAPVEVNKTDGAMTMRFFMPAKYKKNELPDPTDPRVRIVEIPPQTVAALRFTGSTDDTVVTARAAELIKAVQATKWRVTGPVTAFFYNPPWTLPFLRRNEVVVPVTR